jgi:hypothetical protein
VPHSSTQQSVVSNQQARPQVLKIWSHPISNQQSVSKATSLKKSEATRANWVASLIGE